MQFWNELEGRVFDGLYPLRRLTRSEGRTAWFETESGDGQRAAISLTESLTDADEVVKRLEAAQRLRNPNLVAIFKVGRARFENTLFVYALMEHTEQNLSEVLREQPLSKEDVQQVAEALVGALTAIHQQGLLHGRVEPASVLAVGETVKLRSDCLQTPGSTRAGDVAGIGATLFEAFTQHKAEKADDGQINRLPAPFAEIVRNSLSSRWSLGQVAAALRPPAAGAAAPTQTPRATAPTIPAPAEPVAQNPAPARRASTAQEGPPTARTEPTPVSPNFISPIEAEDEEEEKAVSKSFRTTAVYIALAVVVLLIAVWLVFRPKTNSTAANPAVSPPASSLAAAPSAQPPQEPETHAPAAAPTPAHPPDQPAKPAPTRRAPAHAVSPAAAAAGTSAPADRTVWRVVAFTYNRQDQAQRKTEEISQEHADVQASVLSVTSGGRPQFLVTIGGTMNRSQAMALRDKASAMGLPSDTYVQNFFH